MIDTNPIETNLLAVVAELRGQLAIGKRFPRELQSFTDWVEQIREWIEDVGELGIAYESIISTLEVFPFQLSGPTAVKLLETGLMMGFKTERPQDARFDRRRPD